MFDWLLEGRTAVYLVLAVAAVVLLALWVRDRRRHWLLGLGAVGTLVLLYFLLDRFVETSREQVERKVREMAAAVQTRDTARLFANISDQFRRGSLNKTAFRQAVEPLLQQADVGEVGVKQFEFPGQPNARPDQLRVSFIVRADTQWGTRVGRCVADFVRDPDRQWRLAGFRLLNPVTNEPIPIGLPE